MRQSFTLWIELLSQSYEEIWLYFLNFLGAFSWQKAIDFKLRAKLLKSLVCLSSIIEVWCCWNQNTMDIDIVQKTSMKKMFCVYAFCSFWQLLRYMIIYWTYEQTVSENVKGPLGKIRICERNADWILPRDTRSRYNHESLGHRVGICEIIYFGFNLKDKESSWWISF